MMTKKCRICGRTYPIEAAFCGKCGVPLEAVDEPNNTPKPKKPRKTKTKTQNTGRGTGKTLTQGKGHAPDETGEQQDLAAPAGAAGDLEMLIEKASREPGFGNGRGVRNLVEKVIAAQSLRLAAIGYENIRNPEMYVEIQREDLQFVSNSGGKL